MKRLLYICFCLFTALAAMAQQRKDSIQILFPDTAATTLQLDYKNTSQVIDSIIASLQLPDNQHRSMILSTMTPLQGVDSVFIGADSLAFLRLISVATMLVDNGVTDSLICIKIDSCSVSRTTSNTCSATHYCNTNAVWLHIPGGSLLGTGTYDLYADTLGISDIPAMPDTLDMPDIHAMPDILVAADSAHVLSDSIAVKPALLARPDSLVSSPRVVRSSSAPTRPLRQHTSKISNHIITNNGKINNMQVMDSLLQLVSSQHDTIESYRRQLTSLTQQHSQLLDAHPNDGGLLLYAGFGLVLFLVACLVLVALYVLRYSNRRMDYFESEIKQLSFQYMTYRIDQERLKSQLASQTQTVQQNVVEAEQTRTASSQETASGADSQQPLQSNALTTPAASSFEGIYGGKALYESLVAGTGRTIDKWRSVDLANFIEYYRLDHREFVDSLTANYNNLSNNHKVYLILLDMGKTDAEIQQLMNVTQTTIRSFRFRIKAKLKAENPTTTQQTTIEF